MILPKASDAARWVVCPGSVQLGAQFPELSERPARAEGIASHWAGSEMLQGRQPREDSAAPNGVVLTEEMLEGAAMLADDVLAEAVARGLHGQLQTELPVPLPRILPGMEARPDVWLFDQVAGRLFVWEYKFGRTIVEAEDNWQMVGEVCGILDLLGVDGRTDEHITVELRVVQPRAWHRGGRIRSWIVKASDLRGHFNQLRHAAEVAVRPDPPLAGGPQCLHCPAARGCPTLRRNVLAVADYAQTAAPEQLPPDALGAELVLLEMLAKLVKARQTAIETEVEATLRGGQAVGDWTLEPAYGRTHWTAPAEDVAALGDLYGVDLRKPMAVDTPAQAKKKGVDASVIQAYSNTPSAGFKLARDTNLTRRARAAFGAKP